MHSEIEKGETVVPLYRVMDALEHIAFKEDRWVLVRDMYVGLDKEMPRIEVKIYPQTTCA